MWPEQLITTMMLLAHRSTPVEEPMINPISPHRTTSCIVPNLPESKWIRIGEDVSVFPNAYYRRNYTFPIVAAEWKDCGTEVNSCCSVTFSRIHTAVSRSESIFNKVTRRWVDIEPDAYKRIVALVGLKSNETSAKIGPHFTDGVRCVISKGQVASLIHTYPYYAIRGFIRMLDETRTPFFTCGIILTTPDTTYTLDENVRCVAEARIYRSKPVETDDDDYKK